MYHFGFLLLFLLGLCYYTYSKRKLRMGILEKCGIPGPKPHILWGNWEEYNSMPNVLWDSYLIEKYGPICGYYLGAKPFVLVADTQLLYKVSNSNLFLDRPRKVPGGINPDPNRALMMGNLPVPQWKQVRKVVSPTFTPANLKQMLSQIDELISQMLEKVTSSETDFYQLFQGLALDIIGATAFGIAANVQNDPHAPLLKAVEAEFAKTTNSSLVKIHLSFPEISFLLLPLRRIYLRVKDWWLPPVSSALWGIGRQALAIRRRRQHSNKSKGGSDLLQHLIGGGLKDPQIVANSVLFFEAAYETMSAGLGFITHLIVNHPDVQKRIQKELDSFIQKHGTFDTSEIFGGLKYLEAVIKEGLRLFPPQTTFIGRSPSADYTFEQDDKVFTLPKGIHIQVALFQIQNNPQNWPDPRSFQPDRFRNALKNQPGEKLAWQPFGFGRRSCVGEKFAMQTMKLILAKLLHSYKLDPCQKTEKNVQIQYKVATMTPQNGSWATPILRNSEE